MRAVEVEVEVAVEEEVRVEVEVEVEVEVVEEVEAVVEEGQEEGEEVDAQDVQVRPFRLAAFAMRLQPACCSPALAQAFNRIESLHLACPPHSASSASPDLRTTSRAQCLGAPK